MKVDEPSLALGRMKLVLRYCLRLKSTLLSCFVLCISSDGFEGNRERGPLVIFMKPPFEVLGQGTVPLCQVYLQKFAFWDHQNPEVIP